MVNKIKKILGLFIIVLTLSVGMIPLFATKTEAQDVPDFFDRYGKFLPWQKDVILLETVTPEQHLAANGYFGQNFAKRGTPMASLGIPVHAISDGVVTVADMDTNGDGNFGNGRYIVIDHLNGYTSNYFHLQNIGVRVGDRVRAGQEIGLIGDTGNTTGANLELQIKRSNGVTVRATADGRSFQGAYTLDERNPNAVWTAPVDNFNNKYLWAFKSSTEVRADDPTPPTGWDPVIIDPLDTYLKNYGYLFPSGMIAEPVNTATGAFVHRNVDLDLNSPFGPSLLFERFYNSNDNFIGTTGRGWNNTFNIKVLAHPENKFSVKLADGSGSTFQGSPIVDNDPGYTLTNLTPESFSSLERLDKNNGFKFIYTDSQKTKYVFNSENGNKWGKIEKITTIDDKSINFEYDANGNLAKVSDNNGRWISFTYRADNLLLTATDSASRTITYGYNFDSRLTSVTKPNGAVWKYTYDSNGEITSIIDGNNKTYVANVYDANGRVVEQRDANNNPTKFEYVKEGDLSIAKVTDARGNTTTQTHDVNLYLIEEKKPNGAATKYDYNSRGQKIKITQPLGQVFNYEYDERGNVTSEKHPDGFVKVTEYNNLNLPTKITDPSGVITKEYNSIGKELKTTNQINGVTTSEFNANNLLSKTTDANGRSKIFKYNPAGLIYSVEDTGSNSTDLFTYDPAGNKATITDSLNRVTKIENNTFNKPTKIIDPKGGISLYEYDLNGNLSKQIDPENAVTLYESDGNENVVKTTYPNGSTETAKFDGVNNKYESKDRNGNITRREFDVNNRVTFVSQYDSANVLLTSNQNIYDLNDNIIKTIDGRNIPTTFEYDAVGRKVKETNVQNFSQEYKYDLFGRVLEAKDYEGNVFKVEYDALGRKTKEIDPLNNTTEYTYSINGNLLTKKDAKQKITTFIYDTADRISSIKNPLNGTSNYTYDAVGNLKTQTNFAGVKTVFEYDANDNLYKQIDELGNTTTFKYDARNALVSVMNPLNQETITTYNAMGDKSSVRNALGGTQTYEYDANGNLLKFVGENQTSSIKNKYDGLNRSVSQIDGNNNETKFEYDQNGNLLKKIDANNHETNLTYDNLNRLVQIKNAAGDISTIEYSPNGNVTKQTNFDGAVTQNTYDELGRNVATKNAKDFTSKTVYDELSRVKSQTDFKNQASTFEYDDNGNLVSQKDRAGKETIFEYDQGGRLVLTKNPIGAVSKTTYDEVGRIKTQINPENGVTTFEYDPASNLISLIDPRGIKTKFEYDAAGRQTKSIDAYNKPTTSVYDATGRVVQSIDANNVSTSFKFDDANNLIEAYDGNGNPTKFEYDNVGNIKKKTTARQTVTTYEYDALDQLTKVTLPDNSVSTNRYDKAGRLIETVDPRNSIYKVEYDLLGNKTADIDPTLAKTKYEYDENSNLVKLIDSAEQVTTYTYDQRDLLTETKNPLDGVKSYTYDDLGRPTSETNEIGAVTKNTYDALNRVIKTTDAQEKSTTFTYDADGNLTLVKDPLDRVTTNTYDDLNRNISIKNAAEGIKRFSYDNLKNVVAVKDENANTSTNSYDRNYNLINSLDHISGTYKYFYDVNNNLVKEIDQNNNATIYTYDSRDRKETKQLAGGQVYTYKYDANSNLVEQKTPKGKQYTFEYDSRNLLTKEIDPLGNAKEYAYDSLQRLTKELDALKAPTKYSYDALSRLTNVTDALNSSTNYGYDSIGNLTLETDANGHATEYKYDNLSRLILEKNAANQTTKFEYNAVGLQTKKTDGNNLITNYAYDKLNRLTSRKYQNNSEDVSLAYDNVGNTLKVQKSTITYNFTYDKNYRLTDINDSKGKNINYSYDAAGNRTKVTYPDATYATFKYNTNNLLESVKLNGINTNNFYLSGFDYTTTFEYDADLNLVAQKNPNKSATQWKYDDADRLVEVTNSGVDKKDNAYNFDQQKYELNPNGDKIKTTILNNVQTAIECENVDKEKSDKNKKPIENPCDDKALSSKISTVVHTYQYDAVRRLTDVKTSSGTTRDFSKLNQISTEKYTYDKVGNRTSLVTTGKKKEDSKTVNYKYNVLNQITEDNNYKYYYDNNGNRTGKNSKDSKEDSYKFVYDTENNLTRVQSTNKKDREDDKKTNSDDKSEGRRLNYNLEYEYDGLNRRVAKITLPTQDSKSKNEHNREYAGIDSIDYVYDGMSYETLSEYYSTKADHGKQNDKDSNGKRVEDYKYTNTNYIKNGGTIIASLESQRSLPQLQAPGLNRYNDPVVTKKYDVSYFHTDSLGSVVGVTTFDYKAVGNKYSPFTVVDQLNNYDAYGNLNDETLKELGVNNNGHQTTNQNSERYNPNNKTYSGKEFDVETESYYYGSRFYDPANGAWNKADSYRGEIKNPITRNRYGFVSDNPVNMVDFYGFATSEYGLNEFNQDKTNATQRFNSNIESGTNQIATYSTNVAQINAALPGYYSRMKVAESAAYKARTYYHDNIVMNGLLGRLEAKGYELDYEAVGNYVGNQVVTSGKTYQVKQAQYVGAQNVYYGAVNTRNSLNSAITNLTSFVANQKDQLVKMEEWSTKVIDLFYSASAYGSTSGQGYDQFLAQKDAGVSIDVGSIVSSYLSGNSGVKDLQYGFSEYFGYSDPSALMTAFVGGGLTTTLNTEIDAYYVRAQKAEVLRAQAAQQIANAEARIGYDAIGAGLQGAAGWTVSMINSGLNTGLGIAKIINYASTPGGLLAMKGGQEVPLTQPIADMQNAKDNFLATTFGVGNEGYAHDNGIWDSLFPGLANVNHVLDSDSNDFQKGFLIGNTTADTLNIVLLVDGAVSGIKSITSWVSGGGKIGPAVVDTSNQVSNAGRLGNTATREQIASIADSYLANPGKYEIIGGGGKTAEEYLRPLSGTGTKGGSYVDITIRNKETGEIIRINTVDTYANGLPTNRELTNAQRIEAQTGQQIILIPKQ